MSLALGKNNANQKQPLHLDGSNHLLVNDSVNKAVLDTIATNTANINVNVGDVEINVADLEALQATTNTTLAAILVDTDAADSSLNTIEAQSVFTASRLNNIQNKISANTDGTGDTLGQINSNILTKNGEIETSLNSLIGANHSDLVALEASLTSMEGKQVTTNSTLAAILVDTDAADSSLNTIEAQSVLTASRLNNIQNKISANTDGSGDTLGQINSNILTKNGEIETSMNSLISANHTDLVALEASLTSMEAKQDTMIGHNDGVETILTAIDGRVDGLETLQGTTNTHLSEIEGAVETLESCVSGTELQVDIVGGNITGFATETTLSAAEAHLGTIDTNISNAEDHLGNIETAVQLLDNAISGNEMQVDIVTSTLPSGASTLAKQDTIIGHVNGIEGLLGTIDSDTNDIKTAVEILDNAISGNEMQVDIVTSALPSGASTLAKQDDIIGHVNGIEGLLTTIDSDTGAILAKNTEIDSVLDTIKVDTEAIETAVEKLSGVSETQWINTTINAGAFGASLDTTGYTKVRLYGSVDQSFISGASDLLVMGSLTDGGVYFNLGAAITNEAGTSADATGQTLNCLLESPPKFIKIKNDSGSDNYAMTINAKMTHT